MPSGPPHRCVTAASATAGNSSPRVCFRSLNTLGTWSKGRPDGRSQMIRRPPAAEGQPVVRRALAVDDHVPPVAERGPPGQPDLLPHRKSASGSVAIISEYTGTIARRSPGSAGV